MLAAGILSFSMFRFDGILTIIYQKWREKKNYIPIQRNSLIAHAPMFGISIETVLFARGNYQLTCNPERERERKKQYFLQRSSSIIEDRQKKKIILRPILGKDANRSSIVLTENSLTISHSN